MDRRDALINQGVIDAASPDRLVLGQVEVGYEGSDEFWTV